MSDIIINVEGLGKKYIISHQTSGSYTAMRDVIADKVKKILKKKENHSLSREEFWALKDISFEVKQGEAIGIIGRNGAGKSTLLKVLSRITEPTHGRIEINGRVASLLEVGTGFHPELTGRENIFLNGAILGMSRAEIRQKFDEIVDFSGVEKFLDTPVKRYSSGMYVRLAFAVAAHLEPEILIVDEVLAVGDAEFQKKCLGKMNAVSSQEGRTVLFVSHNMSSIQSLCTKAIYLKGGNVKNIGDVETIMVDYLQDLRSDKSYYEIENKNSIAYIKKVRTKNINDESSTHFRYDESIYIEFLVCLTTNSLEDTRLIVIVQDLLQRRIFANEIKISSGEYTLKIDSKLLTKGNYSLKCIVYTPAIAQYDVIEECCSFNIIDGPPNFSHLEGFDYGVVYREGEWIKTK